MKNQPSQKVIVALKKILEHFGVDYVRVGDLVIMRKEYFEKLRSDDEADKKM